MAFIYIHNDWTTPEPDMPGWRRVGWKEEILYGDCWHKIGAKNHPADGFKTIELADQFMVVDTNRHQTPGMLINSFGYYEYNVMRMEKGYKRAPRKLPMNPIFSKPLPLP